MSEIRMDIRSQSDVVGARRAGRDIARRLGFGSADQTRLATAISELARNVIQHAGEGTCVITDETEASIVRIRVVVEDRGPGIADIEKALEYGFGTDEGLGAGLPAVRRLVHELHIDSEPGHTRVTVAVSRRRQ